MGYGEEEGQGAAGWGVTSAGFTWSGQRKLPGDDDKQAVGMAGRSRCRGREHQMYLEREGACREVT